MMALDLRLEFAGSLGFPRHAAAAQAPDPLLLNATPRDCRLGSLTPRRAALNMLMTYVSVHFSPIAFPISYHV